MLLLIAKPLATIKMTKKSKYIIGAATLLLIASIFLPSRLTSYDLENIISFAKNDQIGYAPYILLLFPISLIKDIGHGTICL